jgi:FkbM family methyltransferase
MINAKNLIRTLSIIKNPVVILNLKLRRKEAKITFPNGAIFQVNWQYFCFLRGGYYELIKKGYHIQQISNETFKITTNKYQIVGSLALMCIINELESGVYEYDYRNKIVLDIGGFEGESALFFWSKGAKKIIIYEPVLEHHQFINENIRLNKINAEVHPEGIGDRDDEITVTYDKVENWLGSSFTTNNRLNNITSVHDKAYNNFSLEEKKTQDTINIKIKNISKIIMTSGADVAKIDCEGAEISLVSVPKETLRKLEYVMVEIHTHQIKQELIEKFKNSGFRVNKHVVINKKKGISIIHFKRTPNV